MYPHWGAPPHVAPPMPRPPGPIPSSNTDSVTPLSLHRGGEAPPIKHVSKLGKKTTTTTGPAGTKKGAKNEKIVRLVTLAVVLIMYDFLLLGSSHPSVVVLT